MASTDNVELNKEKVQSSDETTGTSFRYSYPKSLVNNESHTSYLIFHAVKPEGISSLSDQTLKTQQNNFLKNPSSMKTLGMVQLYMPSITETITHEYAKSETTVISDLAHEWLMAPGEGAYEKLINAMGPGAERVADRLQQSLLNNATSVQTLGQIHGQRQTLLYGGTNFRTQTFKFELRPRNLDDLKDIGEIIHVFRKYSSGTHGKSKIASATNIDSLGTIDVPPMWFIEERVKSQAKPRFTDKFAMGPAAITSITVDKTPEQVYKTIGGTAGDPVAIELEIQVQEMVPVYSDFWDNLRNNRMKSG